MDFMISQMFFDNKYYYHSRSKIRALGYKTPLLAGIMPIMSLAQMDHVCKLSGCEFPVALTKIMKDYADSPENFKEAGFDFTANQIVNLINHDVDGIHIYTMNNQEAIKQILTKVCILMNSNQGINHRNNYPSILNSDSNLLSEQKIYEKQESQIPFLKMHLCN